MRVHAAPGELEDYGERGAVAAGGQRARIAVGEDSAAVREVLGEQIGAVAGDGGALLAIFIVNGAGFGEKDF
jgi:hypothetical protein